MIYQAAALVLATMATALIAPGCGGDDPTSNPVGSEAGSNQAASDSLGDVGRTDGAPDSTATPAPSKVEFLAQANRICERGRAAMLADLQTALQEGRTKSGADPGFGLMRSTFLPHMQAQIDEIGKLDAPPGAKDQVEAVLAALQRSLDTIAEQELSRNSDLNRVLQPAGRRAIRYGMTDCGYGI